MGTDDENKSSDEVVGTHFSLPNYPFKAGGHWVRTGEDFEPALGFVRRRGGQSLGLGFTYFFEQTESDWLEDLSMGAEYDRYEWLDGDLDSEELEWNVIGVRTLEGDYLGFEVELNGIPRSRSRSSIFGGTADEYRGIDFDFKFVQAATVPFLRSSFPPFTIMVEARPGRTRALLVTIQIPSVDCEIESTLARLPQRILKC